MAKKTTAPPLNTDIFGLNQLIELAIRECDPRITIMFTDIKFTVRKDTFDLDITVFYDEQYNNCSERVLDKKQICQTDIDSIAFEIASWYQEKNGLLPYKKEKVDAQSPINLNI
ncbi:hypothetical protein SAMN05421780_11072 [Flexibacter flexilis DSM 6793]|uniref:Uncharacterized protein n=1 Tax=Flexibacter flexilis DSM 6793 TaxID=927664 RepID=A0A1I1M816_9BACT|nr:hypothetical protein [Flexibacter flexilis]SFC81549.1 hypothetical protein SAMN05421780_11072 [Flexibacter flexilis DSM 6793]